jgi:hypothetical protein
MDIKKLTQEVLLKNMTPEQQMAVLDSVQASVKEAKAVQKQKIAENVDLVLQALKRIEADMIKRVDGSAQVVEDRVKTIKDGKDGKNGIDGKAGRDGKDGKNGTDGRNGKDGINGVSGERGQDGVGVQNAHIDFDGSLIISLTDGQELNVGEVVPFDVAEKIRVIGNGGGTSQFVIDTLASLQNQINNFQALPSQTGNAGKFLTTDGTNPSWASVAGGLSYQGTWNASTNSPTLASSAGTNGYYYIVGTAGSTNLNGITDWQVGDWLLFNGSTWQKLDQTNLVTSVAGRTGAITLSNSDVAGSAASGSNSDVTSMSGITGGITTPDFITFDVNPSSTPTTPGTLYWDSADGTQTLSLVMANGDATQQIGEEQYYRIKASSAITNGQVVMFTGTVGASGALTGAPATGLTAATASYVMGIATQDIANNGWGYITSFGLVRQLNTNAWTAGTILYYDPTVTGGLTSTIPTAPNAKVQVCAVIYQSASNGSLFVRPAFGGTLGQYEGDVNFTSLATGDVLVRNSGNTVWENKAQSTITAGNVSGTVAIANGGTGATTAGGALTNLGAYAASNPAGYTTNTGTVTSVGGTGTVNGLTLTGTVTTAGNLTLGGTLSGVANSALTNSAITFGSTSQSLGSTVSALNGVSLGQSTPAAVTGTVVTGSSVVASNGIVVNSQTISANYTIASGTNGGSFGPVSVASGITVTIASGSTWTVV